MKVEHKTPSVHTFQIELTAFELECLQDELNDVSTRMDSNAQGRVPVLWELLLEITMPTRLK